MTDIAALKKSVIVDIKAIVVGYAKDGVTKLQLNNEFKEQNGRDVPFIQLGYKSLQDFLKSIPDVVRLVTRGLETLIFPIADEKNAHIVSLVCKTKSVSKRGGKSRRGGRSYYTASGPRFATNRPRLSASSSSNYSSYDYNRDRHIQGKINQLVKNPGSVPTIYREMIQNSLSIAGVEGVEIDNFLTNFSRFSGGFRSLNYQIFGFNSLVDCLKSIPDIVTLRGNGTGKTYCISTAALEKAKNIKANSLKKENQNFLPQKPQQQITSVPTKTPQPQYNHNQVVDAEGARSSNLYTVQTPETEEESINETLKRKMRKVLEEHKDGLCIDDFLEAFEKLHNEQLDLEEIGYFNIRELVDQFDDIFGLSQTDNPIGKAIVYDARKPPPPCVKNTVKKLPIPKDLIQIIEKLLEIHPDGISFSDLERLYKHNCKTELPYVALGYNSIQNFVEKLMSHISFHLYKEKGTEILKLNQQDDEKFKDRDSGLVSPEPSSFITKSPRRRVSKIPPDAATKEDQILQQKINENLDSHDYFNIAISDITDPSNFWFQIIGLHTTDALDILMNKLEHSYREPRDQDYMVPHNYFLMNMLCVAKYGKDWHRAEMIGFPTNGVVELLYVDYGTKRKVTREEVRLIKKEYISFPKQAIKARLALLEPVTNSGIWSTRAALRFLELANEKKFLCKVVNKDTKGPNYKTGLTVQLCEPGDGKENLCLNDVLINEGLAKISQEETLEIRSFYNINSDQEQIEKPYHASILTPPGLKPQYFSPEVKLSEPKTVFKPPPGLKQNSILQKLAFKVLNKQKNDSLDSQSSSPPSVPSSPQFINPTESRIPFRGLPISTVATNPIHSTPKRDGITVSNTNVPPEKFSMPIKIESPASYSQTSKSANYLTKGATTTSTLPSQARYTKLEKFTKMYDGHIINYNSRLYLATGDISYYIYRTDVLVRLIKKLKWDKDIEMITIEEEQCPSLFQELRKSGVRGFSEFNTENSTVTLLPLESCIKALRKIPPMRKELEESIQKVLDNFDPEDQYWTETSEPSEDEPNETQETINEKLKKLEIERRAITKQMSEQDSFDLHSHLTYTQIVEDYTYYLHLSSNQKVQSTNELIEDFKKALNELSMKKNGSNDNSAISDQQHSAQKSVQPVAPLTMNQIPTENTNTETPTNPYMMNQANPQFLYPNVMTQGSMGFANIPYMQQCVMTPAMHTLQRTPPMFGANNAPFANIYYNPTWNHNQ